MPSLPRRGVLSALIRADYLTARSYRLSLAFGVFIGLVNLSVYYFVSRSFVPAHVSQLQGAPDYFAYAAVGVVLTVVLQGTSVSLARRIREEQLTGTFELLAAQPVSSAELALGLVGWPFLYAALRAVIYLAAGVVVLGMDVGDADWVGLVLVMAAAAFALTGLGIVLGALVVVYKRSEPLVAFVTFALGFVGGGFFPLEALPGSLRWVSDLVPTTAAFRGVRGALFKGSGWSGPALELLAFGAVALPVAVLLFDRALAYTRRRGTLSQF